MRIQVHEQGCIVKDSPEAQAIFKVESVTFGQEGCPFCEMQEQEISNETALAQIAQTLKSG